MLKFIYTIFLGLILALFIGLGVSTFYEGPKAPEYPTTHYSVTKESEPSAEQIKKDNDYEAASKKYDTEYKAYSRNVSIVTLVAALLLLVVGFLVERKNPVISGGIVLGGLFTLVYSIIRGFVSADTKYTFIVVTFGVVIALYLGYRSFSHRQLENPPVKKK